MKVRCIDNEGAEDVLTSGATYEVLHEGRSFLFVSGDTGGVEGLRRERFEVIDEPEAQPIPGGCVCDGDVKCVFHELVDSATPAKVDPYEQHRLREADLATMLNQRHDDSWPNVDTGLSATALLHRNLAAEKPRERQVAFPKPARNPR